MTAPIRLKPMPQPLAYRPADAAFVLSVCRATIYEMIADGRLEARKLGTATVIPHESLVAVLAAAPLADATQKARARAAGASCMVSPSRRASTP